MKELEIDVEYYVNIKGKVCGNDILSLNQIEKNFSADKFKEVIEKYTTDGMTAKEYLENYNRINNEIKKIKDEEIKGIITEYEANKKKSSLFKQLNDITCIIHSIKEPMATVLYRRYVLRESLKKIAKAENYNYSYIRRLHIKGLKKIEKIINKENR